MHLQMLKECRYEVINIRVQSLLRSVQCYRNIKWYNENNLQKIKQNGAVLEAITWITIVS